MSASGYLCFALLSLFLNQVHQASCTPRNVQRINPFADTGGDFPFIHRWDASLSNDTTQVYDSTNNTVYSIIKTSNHSFTVTMSSRPDLSAADDEKFWCGFGHKYQSSYKQVTYEIDPRAAWTDKWFMHISDYTIEGNVTTLLYNRARHNNFGPIIQNGHPIAKYEFYRHGQLVKKVQPDTDAAEKAELEKAGHKAVDPLKGQSYIKLSSNGTNIDPIYFIGFWSMVHFRKNRCRS